MKEKIKRYLGLYQEIRKLPREKILLHGDHHAFSIYKKFIKRHRLLIVRNKEIGVALLPLEGNFAEYLKGGFKEVVRRNRNRCQKEGFSFREFNPQDHFDEIMEIHRSMKFRQGKIMHDQFTDEEKVRTFLVGKPCMDGVFSSDGLLRGYIWNVPAGEALIMGRLLGHGDDLEKGIMWFLISEVIKNMLERPQPRPKWFVYDTVFGAPEGLRFFKERMGFKPYWVKWAWKNN
jgi:hypothetical protein